MGEKRNSYRIGKPEGNRPLGKRRRRWVDNIKMDLSEIVCVGMDWIDIAQDRDQWRALVNTVMNLRIPENTGKCLSSCTSGGFSRWAQLHEVCQMKTGMEFLLKTQFGEFSTELAHSPTNNPSGTGLTEKGQLIRHNCLQSDNRL
jgi:hypothetical protein